VVIAKDDLKLRHLARDPNGDSPRLWDLSAIPPT